jgi:TIGR03009 family protein
MRTLCLTLTGSLLCVVAAVAQQPAAQPQAPRPAAAVDRAKLLEQHLQAWEDAMKKITTLQMDDISRTDKDNQLKYVSKMRGAAQYMKPDLAMLMLRREDKPEIFERWICTGAAIYQYVPQEKAIKIHQMSPKKGTQVSDENFLSFMFGMKAEDAKKRFGLQITNGKENDPYYVYIDIMPREDRDKVDFEVARLVLNKDTYLPRQLWFRHPNKDETTWDIPQAKVGVQLNRRDFEAPKAPDGWKMVQGAKQTEGTQNAPRIIRQQQR